MGMGAHRVIQILADETLLDTGHSQSHTNMGRRHTARCSHFYRNYVATVRSFIESYKQDIARLDIAISV